MNILLYAPGLLLVLLVGTGLSETVVCLCICALVQLVLGLPFLATHPLPYLTRSFELTRVFMHQWTVNYRFLSEEMFVSRELSVGLLVLTVIVLIAFIRKIYHENWLELLRRQGKAVRVLGMVGPEALIGVGSVTPHFIISTLFLSNFIGIVFARTLHYQFYCWYFFSLPYLVWQCQALPVVVKVGVLLGVEVAFNVYPSTWWSSTILQCCHVVLLWALYVSPSPLALEPLPRSGKTTATTTTKTKKIL
eukprot:gene2179-4238_t